MRTLLLVCLLFCALPCLAQSSGGITSGKESRDGHTLTHAVVKSKPEPYWPKIKTNAKFTIVLRAAFRSNAKVTDVSLVEIKPAKPAGLSEDELKSFTDRAIEAAYEIKFIPATKDGKPVTHWMTLEYFFQPLAKRASDRPSGKNNDSVR